VTSLGETPEPSDASLRRSVAYRASDGSFVLYNDYDRGRGEIKHVPPESESAATSGPSNPATEPHGPHPLSPREHVEGYGVFTFPYGPISMGSPEAGRFDVRTYGERVLALTPMGGFKSRRILEAVVGRSIPDAALQIERMAGPFSAAHVAAFLAASESADGTIIPRREQWVRALAQETQRIHNHLRVVARVAEAASQNVGTAQTQALAEEVLRLQGHAFGHRWLFGALLPGGPRRRLDLADRRALQSRFVKLGSRFAELWDLFLESRVFLDRLQTTCPVRREEAIRGGAVGPTLRAAGVAWDDRLRVPVPPYTDLFVELPRENEGDALARVLVRVEEIRSSLLLLDQLLDRWPSSEAAGEPPAEPVQPHRGVARVESPSGDLVYDVTLEAARIVRVGYRSASHANWPLFSLGMRGAVLTDFHFALESFGLWFAETDG
jgi:Ni,Fe-hydrogenase III large subunit